MERRSRITAALLIVLCATTACANAPVDKSQAAAANQPATGVQYQQAAAGPVDNNINGYELAMWASAPPRASGIKESLLVLHNADMHFDEGIGFHVINLTASAYPKQQGMPLFFDDPTAFYIVAHQGKVLVRGDELAALLNNYTFNFPGATLRNISISTSPGALHFAGQFHRRGDWVNFSMTGSLILVNDHVIKLKAQKMSVEGMAGAAKLLRAANVKLTDLLSVSANGVQLVGTSIKLNILKLFPPPELRLSVVDAKVTANGILLTVDDGVHIPPIDPIVPSDSYILVKGGDLKITRLVVRNANIQLVSENPNKIVDLSLYNYRTQIKAGKFELLLAPPHDEPPVRVKGILAKVPAIEVARKQLASRNGGAR